MRVYTNLYKPVYIILSPL